MKDRIAIRELIAEIEKTLVILSRNVQFFQEFTHKDYPKLGQTTAAAMVFSQIFVDFYTCAETLFFRIVQTFENSLQAERWHKSLLHKMTLEIEGVRMAVISDASYHVLSEILRFRHFRRYYFDFDYDWDRLTLIEKKYTQAWPLLQEDLQRFTTFLQQLLQEIETPSQIESA